MIHRVLPIIVAELNRFLKLKVSGTEDLVLLSALVDQSGQLAFPGENRIICTVTGIEQERAVLNQTNTSRLTKEHSPLYLNLQVLFSAYFPDNYEEALKFISLVIYFFHAKPVFAPQNTPGLPADVDKLSVEIYNLDLQEQHQLWSTLGAKMMPSISMKLRMLSISRDQLLSEFLEIKEVDASSLSTPIIK